MDLWTQLEFLGEGLSGFQSFGAFRRFHGVFEQVSNAPGIDKLVGLKNIPLIQERLSRLAFSVTKEEAKLNLPDKVYDTIEVTMSKKQREYYDKIAQELAIEIEDKMGNINEMTVEHILTMLLRLAQITSGHIVWNEVADPDTGEVLRERRCEQIDERNPKVELVVEELTSAERDPNGKTIIWCAFVPDIRALHARLDELGIIHGCYYGATSKNDRDPLVARFNNDPEFRVLIANPQTAGEGLNLLGYDRENEETSKTYTDHEIFFSQNWSAILRAQAEDRAHRRGSRMPLRISDLTVPDTIDQEIRERVAMKRSVAGAVVDVREILANVLGI